MSAIASDLPRFIRDLLASPPKRGEGLNLWLFRVARVLHPYRDRQEIIELLKAATAGEPIRYGEIERPELTLLRGHGGSPCHGSGNQPPSAGGSR